MRILVVTQYFWPENFRINDLVSEWLKRGHQVTILTGVPNYPAGQVFESYQAQPGEYAHYKGARVVRLPMLARGQGSFRLLLNYLTFVLSGLLFGPYLLRDVKVDVIFVFEPSPVTVGLPAVLLCKVKKVPIVFWVLDLWPDTLAAMGAVNSPLVLAWVGNMVRFIYNRCTLILGQSRSFLKCIANYCSDQTKIRYFPSWAEEVFVDGKAEPAHEVPKLQNSFTIVFAGNIGEAQNMEAVLDGVELLKDNPAIRWVIVGDGRKFDWLKNEVDRRGLQERVLLPGRFPVERMPSFYAHADALLVSLKRDPVFSMTIPGKVQSYLMAGIPILGMLDGEGAAVIQDAHAGLICEPGDGAGLAKKILELAAMQPAERRRLGANGRKYTHNKFGRTKLMDYLDVLLVEAVTKTAINHKNEG